MTPAEYLRTLDRQATPGPWHKDDVLGWIQLSGPDGHTLVDASHADGYSIHEDNVNLIVALRTLLPALADCLEIADEVANAGAIISEPHLITKLRHAMGRLGTKIEKVQK